jgi:hypothetical protein
MRDLAVVLTWQELRFQRHGGAPLLQLVILGDGDLVSAGALPMINDGRPAFLGEETRAAEHAMVRFGRSESGRVPLPVQQVHAGDMGEGKTVFMRVDIVQVVTAFPVKGTVRVAWHGSAGAGVGQVVG